MREEATEMVVTQARTRTADITPAPSPRKDGGRRPQRCFCFADLRYQFLIILKLLARTFGRAVILWLVKRSRRNTQIEGLPQAPDRASINMGGLHPLPNGTSHVLFLLPPTERFPSKSLIKCRAFPQGKCAFRLQRREHEATPMQLQRSAMDSI